MPQSTVQRILAAAESLFAHHGYNGVSLRQITAAAHVNLAAVNYHFYDKETLYREILSRRLKQINQRRLKLLTDRELHTKDGLTPLTAVIDALARPLLLPDTETGTDAVRLLGRILSERQSFTDELIRTELQRPMMRFGQAIRRHTPGLPPGDFLWRLSFVVGALHHVVMTLPDMPLHTSGICRADDGEAALANFTVFAVKALSP